MSVNDGSPLSCTQSELVAGDAEPCWEVFAVVHPAIPFLQSSCPFNDIRAKVQLRFFWTLLDLVVRQSHHVLLSRYHYF